MPEDEPGYFLVAKNDRQKFWETALAIDQKEREPPARKRFFVIDALDKRRFGIFYGFEQMLCD